MDGWSTVICLYYLSLARIDQIMTWKLMPVWSFMINPPVASESHSEMGLSKSFAAQLEHPCFGRTSSKETATSTLPLESSLLHLQACMVKRKVLASYN